jgi:hypothetical protein
MGEEEWGKEDRGRRIGKRGWGEKGGGMRLKEGDAGKVWGKGMRDRDG